MPNLENLFTYRAANPQRVVEILENMTEDVWDAEFERLLELVEDAQRNSLASSEGKE